MTTKMTKTVKALLIAVRDGVSYRGQASTYQAAMGAGWLVWEDTYKRQANGEYGRGYVVTEAGLEALAAAEAKVERQATNAGLNHASGCKCPRCLREHVGCRRLCCPTCD
jgi:hypothetical protein